MRKLLVAVDSSANARRALNYAIGLAKESSSVELVIAYAHEQPALYGEVALYLPEGRALALQRQHSESVLRPSIELASSAGVRFTSRILGGDVPSMIVACAEEDGCDGIVMGTRGMTAIASLVMGSVATKVIHLTRLPVTLVK